MKLSANFLQIITAFVAGTTCAPLEMVVDFDPLPEIGHPTCKHFEIFPKIVVSNKYDVAATGVKDIPSLCGRLWNNLRRFPACAVAHFPDCAIAKNRKDGLRWTFEASVACNPGMVHSAWWEATKNEIGALSCETKNLLG